MKQLAKSIVLAGALAVAGSANANFWCDPCFSPYIGADYYQAWMKSKSNRYAKSFPGATLYVGAKFYENFGLELGWDWSGKKSRSFTKPAGGTFFGFSQANAVSGTTTTRRTGGHLDLVGFLPVCDCVELTGSVGWGWLRPKVSFTNLTGVSNFSVSSKSRSVFRLGIGANYMVTDCVGLRAKIGWETTSSLRLQGTVNGSTFTSKPFKDSGTLAIGAFVKF